MSDPSKRYGVERNPFVLPRLTSVDPAGEAADPFWVDGFRSLSTPGPLHDFLEERRKAGKPAHILVRGRSGIGRTAAARHILKKYGSISGAATMIVPNIQANSDPLAVLKSWLRDLAAALQDKFEEEWETRLDALLESTEFNESFLSRFDRLLDRINNKLGVGEPPAIAFGFCVDDPPEGFPHSSVVQKVFARANIAVVVVVHTDIDEDSDPLQQISSDPLLSLFTQMADKGEGWIFPGAKLKVADIKILVTNCWQAVAPQKPCPITPEAIDEIWGDSSMALSDVLKILAHAFNEKAESAKGGDWPANAALKISGDDLRRIAGILQFQRVLENAVESLRRG